MGTPLFGELSHGFFTGLFLMAEKLLRKILDDSKVAGRKYIQAAEPSQKRKLGGPSTNSLDRRQRFDDLFIRRDRQLFLR